MEIEKTKMIEKTLPEFCNEAETLVKNTVIPNYFVKIKTESGNAVLINENVWNLLLAVLELHL